MSTLSISASAAPVVDTIETVFCKFLLFILNETDLNIEEEVSSTILF